MRSGNARGIALAALIVVIGAIDLSAHRRDELLQASRIAVAADGIELELSLTPGISVAADVIGTIDRDRDGVLSAEEQRSYSEQVIAATELRVDGRIVKLTAATSLYPLLEELRDGDRSVELRTTATFPELPSGRHEISFINNHRSDISVYMANALKPSDRIVIASQRRDREQQRLAIDFTIDAGRFAALPVWLFTSGVAAWLTLRRQQLLSRR